MWLEPSLIFLIINNLKANNMSTESYKRLLKSACRHINQKEIPTVLGKLLDDITNIPSPEKEITFVKWCSGTKPFPLLDQVDENGGEVVCTIH